MKRMYAGLIMLLLVVLSGCQQGEKERGFGQGEGGEKTFIGGTSGLLIKFTEQRPPVDVFAGGEDPFDVEVSVSNDGEFDITKDDVIVVLTGIDPEEFSKVQADFVKGPEADLEGRHLDFDGNVIESLPQYVVFENLNRVDPVIGSLQFPVVIEACYAYGTRAVSRLCYKEDQRVAGGVCEVNEEKPSTSSGSPVQIVEFQQAAISKDAFAFSFKIEHKANGQIYKPGECSERQNLNKVFVKVDTGSEGLTCSGLRDGSSPGQGMLDLREGSAIVRCRQDVRESIRGAFVKPVSVEATFNYKDSVQTQINVKHTE